MAVHIMGIALLGIVFLIGTTRGINLGALALVTGTAMVLLVSGSDVSILYQAFPADLFLLLVGVTFLFGIATINGTIDWVVDALARLVRGRASAMPWVLFFVAAIAPSIGAFVPAVVALLAPIGMQLAKKYGINPRLAGLMIIHGASCGNFSPVNLLGATVNQTLERQDGLASDPFLLFIANVAYNLILGIVLYVVFGGRELRRLEKASVMASKTREFATISMASGMDGALRTGGAVGGANGAPMTSLPAQPSRLTATRIFTLLIIGTVGAVALIGNIEIGLLALTAAVVLRLVTPKSSAGGEKKIAWDVVLLIGGVVTYVGILRELGTIDFVGEAANSLGSPLLTAFVICAIAAVVSAFASSAGMIVALIPLAIPFLLAGDISVIGMVIAVCISATVVDSTPFSTVGALVLSNSHADDRQFLNRGMLQWGAAMVVTAPIVTMIFVVPSLL